MIFSRRFIFLVTTLLAVVVGVGTFLLVHTAEPTWSQVWIFTLALSVSMVVFNFGAVWLFVSQLQQFKTSLRQAYLLLCVGIGLFGLAQLQPAFITYFTLTFWQNSGLAALPYLVSVMLMYLAIRKFAFILQIKSLFTSVKFVVAMAFVAAGIAVLISQLHPGDTFYLSIMNALAMWDAWFCAAAAVLVWHIHNKIGILYKNGMKWLFVALYVTSFAAVHYIFVETLLVKGNWYFNNNIEILVFFAGAVLFFKAGYEMTRPNLKLPTNFSLQGKKPSVLDIVLYVSMLASHPTDIDPILDDVRDVTSRTPSGQAIPPPQEQILTKVYNKLEEYLTTKEPLRIFTTEDLRTHLESEFQLDGGIKQKLWG